MHIWSDISLRQVGAIIRWGWLCGIVFLVAPAFGSTLYLPLNAPITPAVERLAVVSGLATMGRPYPLARVRSEALRVAERYPELSQRILSYLDAVYGAGLHLTHAGVELSLSNDDSGQPLPNNYGDATSRAYTLRAAGIWNNDGAVKGLAQLRLYDQDGEAELVADLGYLAIGAGWAQLDVGYRDHWFAPGHGDSPLISNNAESFPALTLSNPEPFSFLGLHYEFFVGQLQSHQRIRLGPVTSPGRPYLAGTQISIMPVDWFEFGLSRTFTFGGGQRKVSFSDFIKVFMSPTEDNLNVAGCTTADPNCEFGNQQLALSGALKFDFAGMPAHLYGALGTEDSARSSNLYPGNVLMTMGGYFPWLTEKNDLRVEYSEFERGWYTHHVYRDGYVNGGRVLGGSWGDMQGSELGQPGNALQVQIGYDRSRSQRWDLILRRTGSHAVTGWQYANHMRIGWRWMPGDMGAGEWSATLDLGETGMGDTYWRVGVGYGW